MALSPASRSDIEVLLARHGAEVGHARHVAGTALRLFDGTRELFGLLEEDRDLLEAACLLHDLGYGVDPRRHADAGSEIVRRHGLDGITPEGLRRICALIRLHPASLDAADARSRARLPGAGRILCSAALMRIADALDFSHLQDASVVSVRPLKRTIRVSVRGGAFPRCVELARRQSALWREVLPADVEIRLLKEGPARPLLSPSHSLHQGIHRLLFLQFRTILANVDGAIAGSDDEALHDIRIAIRRMRVLMRAFRRPLAGTSAGRVDGDLQKLNRILGAARDLDVWIGFFSGEQVASLYAGHRLWSRFLAHQVELRALQQATIRRHLRGPGFSALQQRVTRLLRVELPAAAAASPPKAFAGPARRAFLRSLRRALKLGHLRRSRSAEKLHRLRIALRRVRYLGAFFEPVLGRSARRISRRCHAVEGRLGAMRDADLVLSRIQQEGPTPPRQLIRQLSLLREQGAATIEIAWKRLEEVSR